MERNLFYKQIDKHLSNFKEILNFDKAITVNDNTVIVNQANQSIKTILATRAFKRTKKNIFYITRDDKHAEEIAEDFAVLTSPGEVYFIPDYETLAYEERSPHYMIRAQRLRAFTNIFNGGSAIYTVSLLNLVRNIIAPSLLKENILLLKNTDEKDPADIILFLTDTGYEHATQIEKVGQFSKRGCILDIYSPSYSYPIRIEFWGDEIISIRSFSIETQRSDKHEMSEAIIIPCREVILNDETRSSRLSEKVAVKGFYEGIEQDIPLLYNQKHSLFDYISESDSIIFIDNFTQYIDVISNYQEDIDQLYEKIRLENKNRIVPEPDSVILNKEELNFYFNKNTIHYLNTDTLLNSPSVNKIINSFTSDNALTNENFITFDFNTEPSPFFNSDLQILEQHINNLHSSNYTIFIQFENEAQKNRMVQLLGENADKIIPTIGVLHKGFIFHNIKLAVFTDHEIFKRIKHKKLDLTFSKGEAIVDYDTLKPGDYIVHIEHGIGIYDGIKLITIGDKKIECLCIQYTGTDKVYVPTWQLKLVAKYVSEEGNPPQINRLGGKGWESIKQRARQSIELVVEEIVNLYAERKLRKGVAFLPDSEWQHEMEASFIYEDTPDQARATKEIKKDMESDLPMERLLCGDVGFGKTEVAIRVAFKAVMSGYQVAIVVPTTLLAEQHYFVFRERLAQFPIRIGMLSRFRTDSQIRKDIQKIKAGDIDIIIGTHRLLSKDVTFKKIGLLIIDEEHRFGVIHKDRIRQLKANIDTLYMSATPIPRTMNMILSKLKAMSLIQTSPKARLPIRTMIVQYSHEIIKDAIQRELDRGGQVYFVHNRVETIETIYVELRNLMPNIRIAIGHGQLPERRLEKVLVDFAEHKYDVLLATTIIESGIDMPNTNTILINRADMFGLAQLYQIRGRVGRSNRRAYAYLIVPNKLSDVARKRLETLTEYESLGAGYQISMRDLEIRGAGTLLGTKQSGAITSVGFNFYNRLLEQAVKNIVSENPKGMWDEEENQEELRQIELGTDFYFPSEFIMDERQKLKLYKRMIALERPEEFDDLASEIKDRYGALPEIAINVIDYFKMRLETRLLGLKRFMILTSKMIMEFDDKSMPSKNTLSQLIATSDVALSFDTTAGLKIVFDFSDEMAKDKQKKIDFAKKIIETTKNSL